VTLHLQVYVCGMDRISAVHAVDGSFLY
jgi:hypothetical protein